MDEPRTIHFNLISFEELEDYEYTLADTFLNHSRYSGNAYLFLQELEGDSSGRVRLPGMFWASDKQGTQRWSDRETEERLPDLGLDGIELSMTYIGCRWDWYVYEAIRDLQKKCHFDPETTEFADFLGLPHFTIVPSARSKYIPHGIFL